MKLDFDQAFDKALIAKDLESRTSQINKIIQEIAYVYVEAGQYTDDDFKRPLHLITSNIESLTTLSNRLLTPGTCLPHKQDRFMW